jgi:hypothetical protein
MPWRRRPRPLGVPTRIAAENKEQSLTLPRWRIIHGSEPNTSNLRRCGYTMRYVSTRVRLRRSDVSNWHHMYLARGKDHAGNSYGDPKQAYAEMARFRAKHGKNGH